MRWYIAISKKKGGNNLPFYDNSTNLGAKLKRFLSIVK
jgi:hypothetical protein